MCQIEPEVFATVWEERVIGRARKRHRCDACDGFIQIGDSYVTHFSVCEGDAINEKICAACEVGRKEFHKDHHWHPTPGSFREYLTECINIEMDSTRRYDEALDEYVSTETAAAQKWLAIKAAMDVRRQAAQEQL